MEAALVQWLGWVFETQERKKERKKYSNLFGLKSRAIQQKSGGNWYLPQLWTPFSTLCVIRGSVSNLFDLTRSSSPHHELPPPLSCPGLHLYDLYHCKNKARGISIIDIWWRPFQVHPSESKTKVWRFRFPSCDYYKVSDYCFMILLLGYRECPMGRIVIFQYLNWFFIYVLVFFVFLFFFLFCLIFFPFFENWNPTRGFV